MEFNSAFYAVILIFFTSHAKAERDCDQHPIDMSQEMLTKIGII